MKSVFLESKNIFLRPLSKDDSFDNYANWLNDQKTTLFMGSGRFPINVVDLKNYIDSYNNSKDKMLLGIFLKKSSEHIGNITLHMIDWKDRHAEIATVAKKYGADVLYRSGVAGFFKDTIRKRTYRNILDDKFFNINYLDNMVLNYLNGDEASGKDFNNL